MLKQDIYFRYLFVFLIAAILSSCTYVGIKKDVNPFLIYAHYSELKAADFPKEIAKLESIIQKPEENSSLAAIRLNLSILHSHYRNPSPNYQKALKEFETFVSLDSTGGKTDLIQNWLAMLKEIVRLEKENKDFKDKVEKLKYLDIELEEKRKMVK